MHRSLLVVRVVLGAALGLTAAASCDEPPAPITLPEAASTATDAAGEEALLPLLAANEGVERTIDDISRIAQERSPLLAEAAAAVEAARGRAYQAGLYPNPTAQGGTNQLNGQESQYYFQLAQEIVTAGKLRLDRAAACREVRQAELRFVRTRYELLTAARQAFYRTLVAQRRLEVLERLVDVTRSSRDLTQKRLTGGEATRGDVILLEIELRKAQVRQTNAKAELAATRGELAAVLNDPSVIDTVAAGNVDEDLPSYEYADVLPLVLARHADVGVAEVEVERRRLLHRRAIVEPVPNVTVLTGYQYTLTPDANQAIIALEMPIPTWNRNQGAIAATAAEVGRASAATSSVRNRLAGELARNLGLYQVASETVKRFEEQIVPQSRESLKLAEEGFRRGQFDFLRLLQAQGSLVEADLSYLDAQQSRWDAIAELADLLQLEEFPPQAPPTEPTE